MATSPVCLQAFELLAGMAAACSDPSIQDQAALLVLRHVLALPSAHTRRLQDAALDASQRLNHPLFKGMVLVSMEGGAHIMLLGTGGGQPAPGRLSIKLGVPCIITLCAACACCDDAVV